MRCSLCNRDFVQFAVEQETCLSCLNSRYDYNWELEEVPDDELWLCFTEIREKTYVQMKRVRKLYDNWQYKGMVHFLF